MTLSSLITLLQQTSAISSLLSGPTAVYESVLPRGYKLPAIAAHRYGGAHDQDMAGPIDAVEDNFQVDIYADTSAAKESIRKACKDLLNGFVGVLTDGTVVMGTYLERDMDMPFLPNASPDNIAFRTVLAFRFVSK